MNEDDIYRYIESQVESGIPKEQIIAKLSNFARISQEDALDLVERFGVANEFPEQQEPEAIKIKSHFQEIAELAVSAVILAIAFGIFFLGGADAFSDLEILFDVIGASLFGVSLGFILHELAHRVIARKYGYIATFSMWIPGLILGLVTSFMSWIFFAPGAVMIQRNPNAAYNDDDQVTHMGIISVAGPAVNFVLALIFLLLSSLYITISGSSSDQKSLIIILVVGTMINSIMAALNLLPFGPFDGRKVFRWNKLVWFSAAILAAGLFFFVQSSISPLENINSPKVPTSYNLYTDSDGRYSFNYPTDWKILSPDDSAEWEARGLSSDFDAVFFVEDREQAHIALQSIDLSVNYPDIVVDDSILLEYVDSFIENNSDDIISEKNRIAVDPTAGETWRTAYELRYETDDIDEVSYIVTYTYSGNNVYKLMYYSTQEYYEILMAAYYQLIESVRFR
ncbi:site-2 protease family protein [Chloroflexota bacterium]